MVRKKFPVYIMSRGFSLKKSITAVAVIIFTVIVLNWLSDIVFQNLNRFIIISKKSGGPVNNTLLIVLEYLIKATNIVLSLIVAQLMLRRSSKLCFPLRIDDRGYFKLTIIGGLFCMIVTNLFLKTVSRIFLYMGIALESSRYVFSGARGIPEIFLQALLSGALLGVLNELLYRGIILQSLRYYSDTFAIFLSSIAFAMVQQDIISAIFAFFAGVIMSVFCIRAGSIMPAIAIHISYYMLYVFLIELGEHIGGFVQMLISIAVSLVTIAFGIMAYFGIKNSYGNIMWIPNSENDYSFPRTSKQLLLSQVFLMSMLFAFIMLVKEVRLVGP